MKSSLKLVLLYLPLLLWSCDKENGEPINKLSKDSGRAGVGTSNASVTYEVTIYANTYNLMPLDWSVEDGGNSGFCNGFGCSMTHWPYSPNGTPATASTYIASPDERDDALSYDLWGGETEPYVGPPADPSLGGPVPGVKWLPARSDYPDGSWGDLWYKMDQILAINALFPGVGALRAPSAAFRPGNFRTALRALQGLPPQTAKSYHAHHIFAQKFEVEFVKRGINIHEPRFGVWWEAKPHLDAAAAYNKKWDKFFHDYPNATRDQIFQFGKSLMADYGFTISWF